MEAGYSEYSCPLLVGSREDKQEEKNIVSQTSETDACIDI